jgi:hypothetical protein
MENSWLKPGPHARVLLLVVAALLHHCAGEPTGASNRYPDADTVSEDTTALSPDAEPNDIAPPSDASIPDDGDVLPSGDDIALDVPDNTPDDGEIADATVSDVPAALDGQGEIFVEDVENQDMDTADPTDGIVPDTQTLPEDGTTDAKPPSIPAAEPLFRLDTLTWSAPQLCYATNTDAPCVQLTALVNALIASTLDDDTDPTDILIQFHGVIDQDGILSLTIGDGTCERDAVGKILNCDFLSGNAPPPVVFSDVAVQTTAECLDTPNVSAPCFGTPTKDGLVLMVGDISIGLKDAAAWGSFTGQNPNAAIETGHLKGFMPKTIAQTIQFNLPTGQPLTLAQLLGQVPTLVVDGHPGWTLEFGYKASQQPKL